MRKDYQLLRRRHKCDSCGEIFECDECSEAMLKNSRRRSQDTGDVVVYARCHMPAADYRGHKLLFICDLCESKVKSA